MKPEDLPPVGTWDAACDQENELWDERFSPEQLKIVKDLDAWVLEKKAVEITTHDSRRLHVHPGRVVHLEGELSLVAEDCHDHCLMVFSLKEFIEVRELPSAGKCSATQFEIEEFIRALRSMAEEKETRLILKIHDPQSVNLFPDHHFLGKPCMITNSNGDLIWAAYVEACEPLHEWLFSLGKHVEILDPGKFKDEYLSYCEAKIRKIA